MAQAVLSLPPIRTSVWVMCTAAGPSERAQRVGVSQRCSAKCSTSGAVREAWGSSWCNGPFQSLWGSRLQAGCTLRTPPRAHRCTPQAVLCVIGNCRGSCHHSAHRGASLAATTCTASPWIDLLFLSNRRGALCKMWEPLLALLAFAPAMAHLNACPPLVPVCLSAGEVGQQPLPGQHRVRQDGQLS